MVERDAHSESTGNFVAYLSRNVPSRCFHAFVEEGVGVEVSGGVGVDLSSLDQVDPHVAEEVEDPAEL